MLNGRVVGCATVLLVGLGLAGCSSSQLAEKMHERSVAAAKARAVQVASRQAPRPSRPDPGKSATARWPAIIPDVVKPAGKDEIPRAASNDARSPKPTIRF